MSAASERRGEQREILNRLGSVVQKAKGKRFNKRQKFKVLAHHGSVTPNDNSFLQAANRLHVRFFCHLRGHTDIIHTVSDTILQS